MRLLRAIIAENEGFSLNDLSSIQRAALKHTYKKQQMGVEVNPESMSDSAAGVVESLVDLGLLDDFYMLTPMGEKAVSLLGDFDSNKRGEKGVSRELVDDDMRQQAAAKRRSFGLGEGEEFTEGEKAAMGGAGLNPDEIAKLFEDDDKEDKDDKADKCECDCDCDCDDDKDDDKKEDKKDNDKEDKKEDKKDDDDDDKDDKDDKEDKD